STITTFSGSTQVDAGTASFAFTATALQGPSWTTTSSVTGTANPTYTYTFTPANAIPALLVNSITITVPPGTSGTPAIASVTPALNSVMSVTLSGSTLSFAGGG